MLQQFTRLILMPVQRGKLYRALYKQKIVKVWIFFALINVDQPTSCLMGNIRER